VKLWVKFPTHCFLMVAPLVVVEKVFNVDARTRRHPPHLYVPSRSLMDYIIIFSFLPMKPLGLWNIDIFSE
jgi:hypothetical protein